MTTESLVQIVIALIRDHGLKYAEVHEQWLIMTGVHPDYAKAIVAVALESIKHGGV